MGMGMDIHGPKVGLPNVAVDINAPRIGGGVDISGPKVGLDVGLGSAQVNVPVGGVSMDGGASYSISGVGHLPLLEEIVDCERPEVEFVSYLQLQGGAVLPDPNASASFSVKVEATDPPISTGEINIGGGASLNNLISAEDVKVTGKLKAGKKLSKGIVNVSIKVDAPKAKVSISGPSGNAKFKSRLSGKDLSHAKVSKEVQLPGKIIKMKELISLSCKDPIHDVKEMPRFEIYKPKKK